MMTARVHTRRGVHTLTAEYIFLDVHESFVELRLGRSTQQPLLPKVFEVHVFSERELVSLEIKGERP